MLALPAFVEIAWVRFLAVWADPAVGAKIGGSTCVGTFCFVLARSESGGNAAQTTEGADYGANVEKYGPIEGSKAAAAGMPCGKCHGGGMILPID